MIVRFVDTYYFVQMPTSKKGGKKTHGYAFIQFKKAEFADKCVRFFQNFSFPDCNSEKLTCTRLAEKPACNAAANGSSPCVSSSMQPANACYQDWSPFFSGVAEHRADRDTDEEQEIVFDCGP